MQLLCYSNKRGDITVNGVFACPCCMETNFLGAIFEECYSDDDIDVYQCPRCNSKFLVASRNDKYRILFDYAIISLQDDYFNNAVLNAYMSLEEFMKSFIKLALYKHHTDIETIVEFLKSINLAENKKGAFLLSYFQQFNKIISKNKWDGFTKLRNKIIHDGKFVNKKDAYDYCEKMYEFINGILSEISKKYNKDDCSSIDFAFQEYYNKKYNSKLSKISSFVPSILPELGSTSEKTFAQAYEDFKGAKTYYYENPIKKMDAELKKYLQTMCNMKDIDK